MLIRIRLAKVLFFSVPTKFPAKKLLPPTKISGIMCIFAQKNNAEAVRMTLRDHIILADEQYYSFF